VQEGPEEDVAEGEEVGSYSVRGRPTLVWHGPHRAWLPRTAHSAAMSAIHAYAEYRAVLDTT
jgi:hypothetical protein